MITKQDLLRVKTKALRLNTWFRILSRTERAIVDLTIRCVERIRSHILETTISIIVEKILKALMCTFLLNGEKVGRPIAEQVCEIAKRWGNKHASKWKLDIDFVRFLGINAINQQQ